MAVGRRAKSALGGAMLAVLGILAAASPTRAADLTGMNLTARGTATTMSRNAVRDTVTWTLQVYFGTKGNRFVFLQGARGSSLIDFTENRVLIPAGSDRGSKRRKDKNFTSVITLKQTDTSLKVTLDSRGQNTNYANSTYIFVISLGKGTCRVDDYRYRADARLNYISVKEQEGDCTLTRGLPPDMPSDTK